MNRPTACTYLEVLLEYYLYVLLFDRRNRSRMLPFDRNIDAWNIPV